MLEVQIANLAQTNLISDTQNQRHTQYYWVHCVSTPCAAGEFARLAITAIYRRYRHWHGKMPRLGEIPRCNPPSSSWYLWYGAIYVCVLEVVVKRLTWLPSDRRDSGAGLTDTMGIAN